MANNIPGIKTSQKGAVNIPPPVTPRAYPEYEEPIEPVNANYREVYDDANYDNVNGYKDELLRRRAQEATQARKARAANQPTQRATRRAQGRQRTQPVVVNLDEGGYDQQEPVYQPGGMVRALVPTRQAQPPAIPAPRVLAPRRVVHQGYKESSWGEKLWLTLSGLALGVAGAFLSYKGLLVFFPGLAATNNTDALIVDAIYTVLFFSLEVMAYRKRDYMDYTRGGLVTVLLSIDVFINYVGLLSCFNAGGYIYPLTTPVLFALVFAGAYAVAVVPEFFFNAGIMEG